MFASHEATDFMGLCGQGIRSFYICWHAIGTGKIDVEQNDSIDEAR